MGSKLPPSSLLAKAAGESGLLARTESSDGVHRVGVAGVDAIRATADGKIEFIGRPDRTLACVRSGAGLPGPLPRPARQDPQARQGRAHGYRWHERPERDLLDPDHRAHDGVAPGRSGRLLRRDHHGRLADAEGRGRGCPKPHPRLYAETCRVSLGIPVEDRHHVVGIADGGAGVCSVRPAGFAAVGVTGGDFEESGTRGPCARCCGDFSQIPEVIL